MIGSLENKLILIGQLRRIKDFDWFISIVERYIQMYGVGIEDRYS